MTLSDLMRPEGVTVFAVIRSDKNGSPWLDLATVSHSISGSADLADGNPGAKEWRAANPVRRIAQLRLTVEPGVASIPVPQTPARRGR